MTEIFLNDAKLDLEDTDGTATAGDLLGTLDKELSDSSHLLVQVTSDGEDVIEWLSNDFTEKPLSTIKDLRLFSSSAEELVKAGKDSCGALVKEALSANADIVLKLRSESKEGLGVVNSLFSLANSFASTIDAMNGVANKFKVDFLSSLDPEIFTRLLGHFKGAGEAMEKDEMPLLADILDRDIRPILEEIEKSLAA